MAEFESLNTEVIGKRCRSYITDKGQYVEFKVDDAVVYVDVNTLDAFKCPKDQLPDPVPVTPQ